VCKDLESINVAVILSHQGLDQGLISGVSSEGRVQVNYAWMLAHYGHQVDLIGAGGQLGAIPIDAGDDTISPELPNLRLLGKGSSHLIKPRYDVCIMHEGMYSNDPPNADLYIQTSFRTLVAINNLRHIDVNAHPWAKGKDTKVCIVFKDYRYQYPDRTTLKKIHEDFPVLPFPVPGSLLSEESFQRKEITWTTKHIYGYENYNEKKPLDIKQIPLLMINIFRQYNQQYIFNNFAPDFGSLQSFNVGQNGGVYYDQCIEILSKSKLAINAYFVGSILESAINGCLPLVWKYEFSNMPFSNWPLNKAAEKMDCILCPSDGPEVIEQKIKMLMENEEYYNEVLQCFQEAVYDYTFEGSYKIFKELLKDKGK